MLLAPRADTKTFRLRLLPLAYVFFVVCVAQASLRPSAASPSSSAPPVVVEVAPSSLFPPMPSSDAPQAPFPSRRFEEQVNDSMATPQAREVPSMVPLPGPSAQAFEAWVQAVGEVRPGESFGELVVRTGRVQLGRPYAHAIDAIGTEVLDLELGAFQCVSFVESALALARCTWLGTPRGTCFAQELVSLRYRSGVIDGFASRLHYYEEWLTDNETRGHLNLVTAKLGGQRLARPAQFMSHHPSLYPPMNDGAVKTQILTMEKRVSAINPYVIDRRQVPDVLPWLQTGDIVAVTTRQPDLLISHTGFLERLRDGTVHLLHASSAHGRVLLTPDSLSGYILRRPGRQGILIGRPIAPRSPGPNGIAPKAVPPSAVVKSVATLRKK